MYENCNGLILKKKKLKKIFVLFAVFLILLCQVNLFNSQNSDKNILTNNEKLRDFNQISNSAAGESILIQGNENFLNITDYGNLYKINQEVSLTNQEELNLTYYLDDEHGWKISEIQNSITNIENTREWVNNSDIQNIIVFQENEIHESDHYYVTTKNRGNSIDTIYDERATSMRVHFRNISFVQDSNFIFIDDQDVIIYYVDTGFKEDFYSPWILGNTLNIYIESSGGDYGYYVDFYEFLNDSSNIEINEYSWGFNSIKGIGTKTISGSSIMGNTSALYLGLYGVLSGSPPQRSIYYQDDFIEVYQNISVPRGRLIDAYISFDYYPQFCMRTNNNFLYFEINKEKIYSKGILDIVDLGRNQWYSTGKIYMALWDNTSNIFNDILDGQPLNISVGIKSASWTQYSGYIDRFQQVFGFDNITLGLITIANSSQGGINLTINEYNLIGDNEWGESYLTITDTWQNNPVILTVNTTSPSLNFDLNTTLYGYRNTTTKINQLNDEGISYRILNNDSIYWEFYHNFFMPSQYSDFEFILNKPVNWKFISALDPTLQSKDFEGGNIGDNFLRMNKTNALYPGWWKFIATSPNYINEENTRMYKDGQWGYNEFYSGDSIRIKTQVNSTNEIPLNLDTTVVNLTIYYPNSSIWYQESKIPLSNGTVIFSDILLTSLNSVGGVYNYTLFWSNGTAIGGLLSNFIVIHDSYLTILKPDDAKLDNQTGGTVGDIIPLRIYLRDAENDIYISDALISYNWTTGTVFLEEASLGIYEAVLDTADLGGFGLYNIIISTSKVGFINSNLILRINLGEDTNLQRLESDSKIVIHTNSTIRFFYYSEFDEEGILGAQVLVNISNPAYYTVQDESDGYYSIEFSTEFIDSLGVYRLVFEFSAIGYEPQTHIFQFEIINPTVTREKPNYMLLGILFASIGIGAIFAALSLRSYVILPRKRRKESELLAETQRFKDIRNIQAIVIIHKLSGIPIFSKSYSILEKHKKELFSGFIQAITTIGEEFVERESAKPKMKESAKGYGSERIMELDFKYFYCLIADLEEVRAVLVLSEKSSERLKSQLRHLLLALNLNLSEQLQSWDGSLDQFEVILPSILNEYFELYYKESFQLNIRDNEFLKITKDKSLNKMEIRVLNVIDSVAKSKENIINLDMIINLVHEENKDIIIKAIESLIAQKIIIPFNY